MVDRANPRLDRHSQKPSSLDAKGPSPKHFSARESKNTFSNAITTSFSLAQLGNLKLLKHTKLCEVKKVKKRIKGRKGERFDHIRQLYSTYLFTSHNMPYVELHIKND